MRSYRADLMDCVAFLDRRGLGSLTDADARVAPRVSRATSTRAGWRRTSIARRLATLRSFFRFLLRRGRVAGEPGPGGPDAEPARDGCPPTSRSTRARRSSARRSATTRRAAGTGRSWRLLYASGVRVAELSGLDVEDVDLREGSVRVLGKGRKERIVPLGAKAIEALARISARARAAGARSSGTPGAGA